MAGKKHERPRIARCILVAGNLAAGITLYRLLFWKPTREINGRPMFAKPRTELEFETGLTSKQVENALGFLRKKGLIQTGQHQFHGRNVLHVAVTASCYQALDEHAHQSPETGALSPPELVDTVPPNGGASYTTYKQGGLHGGQQGDGEQSLAEGSETLGDFGSEEDEDVKKVRYGKAAEALAAAQVSPEAGKKLHKPDGAKSLELFWVKTLADASGKFVPSLTMKDMGLLNKLRIKCPPGKVKAVIRHAIENWIEFVKKVEVEAGIKTTPAEPRIDFLLKYAGVAINMAAPPKPAPKVKQEAKPVAKKATKPVQLIADEEAPLSAEEALAILNDEDDAG